MSLSSVLPVKLNFTGLFGLAGVAVLYKVCFILGVVGIDFKFELEVVFVGGRWYLGRAIRSKKLADSAETRFGALDDYKKV